MQEQTAVDRLADRMGASRAEAVGLLGLLVAAMVVLAVLWAWHRPGPVGPPGDSGGRQEAVASTFTGATLVIHVTGAVVTPGVVSVVDGARVVDVLALAGGAAPDADLSSLNLARLVVDGEQILVPRHGPSGGPAASAPASAWDQQGRLDLNRATAQELQELPGVGPVLAERIIQHRERNGPFKQPGDLRAVPGIGEKTFQSLASLIVV